MNCAALIYASCSVLYFCFAIVLLIGLKRLAPVKPNADQPFVSVVIPARNEENNIAACLMALRHQSYPHHLFEILIVDDHSSDRTLQIITDFQRTFQQLQVLSLKDLPVSWSPKKAAIETGIRRSRGKIILTTDADCTVPPRWIELMVQGFDLKTAAVCSWLLVEAGKTLLGKLESLDSLALVTVGASMSGLGLPFLGNGANFAYRKDIFERVNGFSGHAIYGSGDDDLFIQRIRKSLKLEIVFQNDPEAAVRTKSASSFKSYLSQRIRWASKSALYPWGLVLFEILIYAYILSLLLGIPLFLSFSASPVLPLACLAVKFLADYIVIKTVCARIKKTLNLCHFVLADLLQMMVILFAGIYGPFASYWWKDRKYAKGRVARLL